MTSRIILILAALMTSVGVLAIGVSMLVNTWRGQPVAPQQPPENPPPQAAPSAVPAYAQPQEPAPIVLQSAPPVAAIIAPPAPAPEPPANPTPVVPPPEPPSATPPPVAQPMLQPPPAAPVQPNISISSRVVSPQPGYDAQPGYRSAPGYGPANMDEITEPAGAPPPLQVSDADAYQHFYDPLRAHGEWVFVEGYGHCWRPVRTAYGWRPYADGRWVWTNCGWAWDSPEPWGWATYHYGRWFQTVECGWLWSPGRVWAPAWVCWRRGPDFVAWAPLPPGAPIGGGFHQEAFGIHFGHWTLVYERDFLAPSCAVVALPAYRCQEMLPRATTVINVAFMNQSVVNVGPGHRHIEQACGKSAPLLKLQPTEVTRDHPHAHIAGNSLVVLKPTSTKPATGTHANIQHFRTATVVKATGSVTAAPTPKAPEVVPETREHKHDKAGMEPARTAAPSSALAPAPATAQPAKESKPRVEKPQRTVSKSAPAATSSAPEKPQKQKALPATTTAPALTKPRHADEPPPAAVPAHSVKPSKVAPPTTEPAPSPPPSESPKKKKEKPAKPETESVVPATPATPRQEMPRHERRDVTPQSVPAQPALPPGEYRKTPAAPSGRVAPPGAAPAQPAAEKEKGKSKKDKDKDKDKSKDPQSQSQPTPPVR